MNLNDLNFNDLPQAISILIKKVESLEKALLAKSETINDPKTQWLSVVELLQYLPNHPKKTTIYAWVEKTVKLTP